MTILVDLYASETYSKGPVLGRGALAMSEAKSAWINLLSDLGEPGVPPENLD